MQNEEGKYAIHRDTHNKMTVVCLELNGRTFNFHIEKYAIVVILANYEYFGDKITIVPI